MFQIKKIDTELDTAELACTKTDGKAKYDFNLFASPLKFVRKIHNYPKWSNRRSRKIRKFNNQTRKLQTKEHTKKEEKDKVS